jgi:hypothetical protein
MKKIILSFLVTGCCFLVTDASAADVVARPNSGAGRSVGVMSTRAAAVGTMPNARTGGAETPVAPAPEISRAAVKRTSVMNSGTTIAGKGAPVGLYSDECKTYYDECLNQFCMLDNEDGGRCACSDDYEKYETQRAAIKTQLANANVLSTLEVEKIQAGARADIIFSGDRSYDADGNVVTLQKQDKQAEKKKRVDLSLWLQEFNTEFEGFDTVESLADQKGAALYSGARDLCLQNMPKQCARDVAMLTQVYLTQIRSDCSAFANLVKTEQAAADQKLADAQKDVRDARLATFEKENKFNRGECLINFKQCMVKPEVCGGDWSRCAATVAAENMQNSKAISTANTYVSTVAKFKISASTQEMLASKRTMCEDILDQCIAVRDMVWPDFIRDIAPELKVAELNLESNMRQSCMADISACITGKACRDNIQQGENIDACLTQNGQIARGVCKNVIDPCERMEPLIWDYVVARLRAMGADRCTEEVKACYAGICGENFMNCIGMDYTFMHEICPLEKLVVCKNNYAARGEEFTMNDLDKLLMGFYLNVDNAALDNCQNLVETKMMEVCGSTTDCNRFTADDTIGTGSLAYQKDGNIYRISGMISLGRIKVGNGYSENGGPENAGRIDVEDYVDKLTKAGVDYKHVSIADRAVDELYNIQGTVNRIVDMIALDPKIQYCVTGRDLSQITGKTGSTTGRFPNLLNQVKMQITVSALRQAQDNYNKKYNDYIARASRESSTDMANLMCNKLPSANGTAMGLSAADLDVSGLDTPYMLLLEIAGVSDSAIAAGGTHSTQTLGNTSTSTETGMAADAGNGGALSTIGATVAGASVIAKGASSFISAGGSIASIGASTAVSFSPAALIADSAVKAIGILASSRHKVEFDGGTREMWSVFNRQDRVCHYCTEIVTKDCKTKGSRGFLGLWDSRGVACESSDPVQECKDIQM